MREWLSKDKTNKNTAIGLSIGFFLGLIALFLFRDISFFIGGIAIMIVGFSLMYYLSKKKNH